MLLVNPGPGVQPLEHTLLWGQGRRYYVPAFPGPLSIKSVLQGGASWTTDEARHELGEASYLVINDAHPYTIEIEAREPVETFCVFFAKGFVEQALRSLHESDQSLLERPVDESTPVSFHEALLPKGGPVGSILAELRKKAGAPGVSRAVEAEDLLVRLALAMGHDHRHWSGVRSSVSAMKASTRHEIFRRLCAARDLLDSSLDQELRLHELARSCHLSPFHLHRHFRRTFGETPQAYRRRHRLERAARALRNSGRPITEIALDAGFSSLGSFSSLFKRRYGASPLNYRRGKEQD